MPVLAEDEPFFVPPLHNGINEPVEGKFYEWHAPDKGDGSRELVHLRQQVRRQGIALTVLWMLSLTFAFVVAYRW